ncbi:MAG: 16S rRNA (uracil(1498)-N(3))-methyltransferase [Defluviitaleaceae bacterium]|nr:16S rRNA (uracil(1498)-N(3))-methyltransferase [Defluviitaleaceae bacterium]
MLLIDENASHGNVLRLRVGEEIVTTISDGIDMICKVIVVDKQEIRAEVIHRTDNTAELPIKITLFQALPKGDKMTDIIESVVELGIHQIVPVETARCVARSQNKGLRWQKVAEGASKLSHRSYIPKISSICSLSDAIGQASKLDVTFACYEGEKDRHLSHFLQDKNPATMGFFIGPEGGFTDEEINLFSQNGIPTTTLGGRILRSQSAASAVMAGINFWKNLP